ncbi:MAG: LysM peptidoglycan-binding domain-containing protein, partial [Anaerolineae bacterium]|nr:LysM peptidoglycan-binding domain-containing protein [Anaerolineae bacterium]
DANSATSVDAQLFQDDDGRYWAVGAKTGEWYFYDEAGWHPAHEYQSRIAPQAQPSQAYFPQSSQYGTPAQPVDPAYYQSYQSPQPAQNYPGQPQPANYQQAYPVQEPVLPVQRPPGADPAYQAPAGLQPAPSEPQAADRPIPPQGAAQSGTWYYHNGEQWLKYSTGEPAEETPPDPKLILDQEPDSAEDRVKPGSESVVAELFEDEQPPVEVVDVEVITVIEPEPELEPEPKPKPAPRAAVAPEPTQEAESVAPTPNIDEFIPRRNRPTPKPQPTTTQSTPVPKPEAQPAKKRTPSEGSFPVRPRKKTAPNEPTIIIPTGSSSGGPTSSPTIKRARTPTRPIKPDRRRRARENTIPMEPVPLPGTVPPPPVPAPDSRRHRQVTQPLPRVASGSIPRAEPSPVQPTQRSRQPTKEKVAQTPLPASPAPLQQPQTDQKKYTFGDVLRSFPSTIWTLAAGIAVLIIFAFIFIGAISIFSGDSAEEGLASSDQLLTPTLDAGLAPDSTPTTGPTPTDAAGPVNTPAPVSMATFSSPDLGFTLEYPGNWKSRDDATQAMFSPSLDGLDPAEPNDISIRIGTPNEVGQSISDLLSEVLTDFPSGAESLNEGTISIASQTWTSTQIRFEDENLGGQGIATVAVTNKDDLGYYLIAVAPADAWNSVQPTFQSIINSFRFAVEDVIAQATIDELTPAAETGTTAAAGQSGQAGATPVPAQQPAATPIPAAAATPVVYTIQSGDTLLEIAVRFGVDVDLLTSENGITNPQGLQLGQELIIPFTAEELAAYVAGEQVVSS